MAGAEDGESLGSEHFRVLCVEIPRGESPADQISAGTVDYCHQVAPAILACKKMRHVDCPAAVGLRRDTLHAFHSRPVAIMALTTLPAMLLHNPMDSLSVKRLLVPTTQHCSNPSGSVLGKFFDHLTHFIDKPFFNRRHGSFLSWLLSVYTLERL